MVEAHEEDQELFWGFVQAFRDRARAFGRKTKRLKHIMDEFGSLAWRGLDHLFR